MRLEGVEQRHDAREGPVFPGLASGLVVYREDALVAVRSARLDDCEEVRERIRADGYRKTSRVRDRMCVRERGLGTKDVSSGRTVAQERVAECSG